MLASLAQAQFLDRFTADLYQHFMAVGERNLCHPGFHMSAQLLIIILWPSTLSQSPLNKVMQGDLLMKQNLKLELRYLGWVIRCLSASEYISYMTNPSHPPTDTKQSWNPHPIGMIQTIGFIMWHTLSFWPFGTFTLLGVQVCAHPEICQALKPELTTQHHC